MKRRMWRALVFYWQFFVVDSVGAMNDAWEVLQRRHSRKLDENETKNTACWSFTMMSCRTFRWMQWIKFQEWDNVRWGPYKKLDKNGVNSTACCSSLPKGSCVSTSVGGFNESCWSVERKKPPSMECFCSSRWIQWAKFQDYDNLRWRQARKMKVSGTEETAQYNLRLVCWDIGRWKRDLLL